MAYVVDKRMEKKLKIDDVPIVRDFSKVFPEDLVILLPIEIMSLRSILY